ncbi:MAG TPA: nucleotidyltransferase domain-containing protein [Methanothrix sp.]|nr:nucleotidyltransferase domain-containing protein [Methanothrix sp.]
MATLSNPERWKRHAPLPGDIKERLDSLAPILESGGVLLAHLFGSLAGVDSSSEEGREWGKREGEPQPRKGRPPGDVDLAVLRRDGPAWEMEQALEEALGTDRLDLVDLREASPVLRFEVLRGGRLIYAPEEELRERFEMETLRLYRDTEPLRRRQRQALRERMEEWRSREA